MHTGEVDEYVWLYMNIYLWVCECIHLYIYIYIYLRKDDWPAIAEFHLVSRVVLSSNHLVRKCFALGSTVVATAQ